MGVWGSALYDNDTTCDVRDVYMGLLMDQVDDIDAYKKTLKQCADYIGDQDEPFFWYALAECQWRTGRLLPEVKEKALWWIEQNGGLELWENAPSKEAGWKKTLQKLKAKLESPMPARKKVKRPEEVNGNLWEINDLYAYQFHRSGGDSALQGKYIVLQKIEEGMLRYQEKLVMRVHVLDKVFDELPSLADIAGVRILPLDFPYRENISHDGPIEYFSGKALPCNAKDPIWMSALLPLYKKRDYPKKYLFYLGNTEGPANRMQSNQELSWNHIESSFSLFHKLWDGIEYDTIGDGIYDYVQP